MSSHQGNFSLKQTTTGNQAKQPAQLWSPVSTDRSTQTNQASLQKGEQKECKSQKNTEFSMRLSLLGKSEATPTKHHHYDGPNMSQAGTTTGMLKWPRGQ